MNRVTVVGFLTFPMIQLETENTAGKVWSAINEKRTGSHYGGDENWFLDYCTHKGKFMSVYTVLLFEMFASEQFSDAGGWWAKVHGITQRIDHVNLKSGQGLPGTGLRGRYSYSLDGILRKSENL